MLKRGLDLQVYRCACGRASSCVMWQVRSRGTRSEHTPTRAALPARRYVLTMVLTSVVAEQIFSQSYPMQ